MRVRHGTRRDFHPLAHVEHHTATLFLCSPAHVIPGFTRLPPCDDGLTRTLFRRWDLNIQYTKKIQAPRETKNIIGEKDNGPTEDEY